MKKYDSCRKHNFEFKVGKSSFTSWAGKYIFLWCMFKGCCPLLYDKYWVYYKNLNRLLSHSVCRNTNVVISWYILIHINFSNGFCVYSLNLIYPLTYSGGRDLQRPHVVFCPLIQKSSDDPYLKILDFYNFLLRMPHEHKCQYFSSSKGTFLLPGHFPPPRALSFSQGTFLLPGHFSPLRALFSSQETFLLLLGHFPPPRALSSS